MSDEHFEPASPSTPSRRRRSKRPLWTFFLTPAAVLIAGTLIAGAVFLTDDDGDASPAATPADEAVASTVTTTPQTPTERATLYTAMTGYARELGLDVEAFQQCITSNEAHVRLINDHLRRGQALGVTGTPTFFVNNKMIIGSQPLAIFEEVIQRELDGSPTSVDGYSDGVRALAQQGRFAIVPASPDTAGAHFKGSPNAKVIVAEFSDFQCPFCQRWAAQTMPRLEPRFGDDVALAFLHFPITQIHENAGNASLAAICAADQGRFWEMHDLLFAKQAEWGRLP